MGHKFERGQEEILSHTKMLSFCDNKYFPPWKDDDLGYLSMDLKSFYVQTTQGEVKDSDGQVKYRSDLDELLGMSKSASARVSRLVPNG